MGDTIDGESDTALIHIEHGLTVELALGRAALLVATRPGV